MVSDLATLMMTCLRRFVCRCRDHFGEMYQLFLRHCRDTVDEESVLYTIVEGATATSPKPSTSEDATASNQKIKTKKAPPASEYSIMNVKA